MEAEDYSWEPLRVPLDLGDDRQDDKRRSTQYPKQRIVCTIWWFNERFSFQFVFLLTGVILAYGSKEGIRENAFFLIGLDHGCPFPEREHGTFKP